jgi:short subunit dehydrogenase-like uncharacterized protein
MAAKREFDLVLYGATGFVGKLTALYLAKAAPPKARIALAGRSLAKLKAVRDEVGGVAANWSVAVADASDQHDLDALAKRTKVVVTTVGPYIRYGLPVVEACAKAGTHYADLTGEPPFIRDCIDRFDTVAAKSGAKIVNSCGFDSVPSDLSAYLIYRKSLEDNTGELGDTTLVAKIKGGASGGTIDSGRAMFEAVAENPATQRIITDPYSLSPDRELEPKDKQSDLALRRASSIDPSLDGWVSTFVMAAHNGKVVRRSNALLGWAYGKNFRYNEVMSVGSSIAAPVIAAGVTGGLVVGMATGALLSRVSIGRKVLDRVLPKVGTGPSEKTRDAGFFNMKTFARTSSGAKYLATFAAQGDPGYKATAVLLGESGLSLAFDDKKLSELAGILTPATAMGEPLADRLRAAGMTITVERLA